MFKAFYSLSKNPYLSAKLVLNQHRPLYQRILMKYRLEALNRQEVADYLKHHMKQAGAAYDIFNEPATEAIYSLSNGWPRMVNQLATQCLIYGCQVRKEYIDEEVVRIAAEEVGL